MNYGCWTRGHSKDYDAWAEQVGDNRWSYEEHLPYFRRTEHHYDDTADPQVHGFHGPIHTTSGRAYPLRDSVHKAFLAAGFRDLGDGNDGDPLGVARWTENWRDGKRQPSFAAYDMSGVLVHCESYARRIILDKSHGSCRATGVELADGRVFLAEKEVIIACGAHRTPQLLCMSPRYFCKIIGSSCYSAVRDRSQRQAAIVRNRAACCPGRCREQFS